LAGRGAAAGRPQSGQAGAAPRFETLAVLPESIEATGGDQAPAEASDPATALLPPGFSADAPTDAVALSGGQANVDRGMLADRLAAIGRGEFQPGNGPPIDFAFGAGPPPGAGGGPGGFGFGGGDGRGGFGGGPGGGPGG